MTKRQVTVTLTLTHVEIATLYEAIDQWREVQRECLERGEECGEDAEQELELYDRICRKLTEQL
jgi:hypothetical protein